MRKVKDRNGLYVSNTLGISQHYILYFCILYVTIDQCEAHPMVKSRETDNTIQSLCFLQVTTNSELRVNGY